jgi:preprotein translocase subunit YajC
MFDLFAATNAWAMAGGGAGGGEGGSAWMSILPLVLMFGIFYLLLIRPQQKKAKQHREMLGNIRKGDQIITGGGIYGKVTGVNDNVLVVEIAPQVRVKVSRGNVSGVVTAGGQAPAAEQNKK